MEGEGARVSGQTGVGNVVITIMYIIFDVIHMFGRRDGGSLDNSGGGEVGYYLITSSRPELCISNDNKQEVTTESQCK